MVLLMKNSFLRYFIDKNECKNGESKCDDNADCTNTVGSYSCKCKTGFSGDGFSCSGKYRSSLRVRVVFRFNF